MSDLSRMTATTRTVSTINQGAIIQALRDHGPLPRVRIGELTGLSPATVNRLTTALIKRKLIVQDGQEPSTGGRPSVILRYTGGPRVVSSIHLRGDRVIGGLVDFDGNLIERQERLFSAESGGASTPDVDHRLEIVASLLSGLLALADRLGTPCLSVGVSVPGVVAEPDGRIGPLPELGWPELPLGEFLRSHTDLPLTIENDANALAYGEYRRGAGIGTSNMVAVLLDNGMGAGIISKGALHRGQHFEAGEIGYLLMERSSLRRSYGTLGDLEDRVGSAALTRSAHARGLGTRDNALLTAHDIIQLAQTNNPIAREMADEILDMVSMAVGALSVILDPEIIVVGSGITAGADDIIPQIQGRLSGRILRVPGLVPSTLGEDGVLLGAAELAMSEVDQVDFVPR
ncbi:ROK family transcriptional regulator [Nocardioides panacis]|uniref:ROK family transcriptional regulator n=1 Tax=Nocardioides panacis TaxID=2849501 RepID=A0A975T1Z9_9ACTN|nr:ROK family transcriptional regulator [Nocardioides panacis]QWZ10124.1 ROK family transcriptional regulator [Nocardioides panacis]